MRNKLTDFLTDNPKERNTTHLFAVGCKVMVNLDRWTQATIVLKQMFNKNGAPSYLLQGPFKRLSGDGDIEFHYSLVEPYCAICEEE